MTPAQRLARLPGCWRPGMRDVGDHNVPYSRIVDVWPNGYPRRWTNEGEDGDRYTASLEEAEGLWRGCVPDLTDPATGGVMLGLLPCAVKVVTRTEPRSFRLMWLAEDGEGLGPRQHTTPWMDTLAEAVARVAVAVGRAG